VVHKDTAFATIHQISLKKNKIFAFLFVITYKKGCFAIVKYKSGYICVNIATCKSKFIFMHLSLLRKCGLVVIKK
jgi:hypothetical protein